MATSSIRTPTLAAVALFLLLGVALFPQRSEAGKEEDDEWGEMGFKEWCIADEQTAADELQRAMEWACGKGGGDCSKIEKGQACYFPDSIKDRASYAFNNYYQRFKRKGATCYFNSAAMVTDLDPSQGSCKFEYLP